MYYYDRVLLRQCINITMYWYDNVLLWQCITMASHCTMQCSTVHWLLWIILDFKQPPTLFQIWVNFLCFLLWWDKEPPLLNLRSQFSMGQVKGVSVVWIKLWLFNNLMECIFASQTLHSKVFFRSVWICSWLFNSPLVLNTFSHILHVLQVLSWLLWIFLWFSRYFSLTSLGQSSHWISTNSVLWRFSWPSTAARLEKLLLQILHFIFSFPCTSSMCFFRTLSTLNFFPHVEHGWPILSECFLFMWSFKEITLLYDFEHWSQLKLRPVEWTPTVCLFKYLTCLRQILHNLYRVSFFFTMFRSLLDFVWLKLPLLALVLPKWLFMCMSRFPFWVNILVQMLQENLFILLCNLLWRDKDPLLLKPFWQVEHKKGFSPVCV